ncbi:MAG: DUF2029 domain-containing protein [Chloroflexi bacterium]|nr:DUF2029 domain-containing protein [Chloroflexota bacterium]
MTLDPVELKARLTRRLTLVELATLTTAVIFGAGMIVLLSRRPIPGLLMDFALFSRASGGDLQGYYYGLWGIPLFYPFASLPFNLGALAWQLFNIGGMFFAARLFTGKSAALIFSYQMFVNLYFGQISGVLCFGIALMWLGLSKRNWLLAGLGLTIAVIKPQVGLIAGLIWLFALLSDTDDPPSHRRACWMALIVPAAVVVISFLIQPDWLAQTFVRLKTIPPNDEASFTTWDYIGAWGLLLLIPPLILPLNRQARLLALITAWLVSAPYFQPWDIAALLMLLPNWLPLLSWGALLLGYPQMPLGFLLLLTAFYIWQISPGVFRVLRLAPVRCASLGKIKFYKLQKLEHDQQDEQRVDE